jgi:hypothetical protein
VITFQVLKGGEKMGEIEYIKKGAQEGKPNPPAPKPTPIVQDKPANPPVSKPSKSGNS